MTAVEGRDSSPRGEGAAEPAAPEPPSSAVVSHRSGEDPEQVRAYWTLERRRAARPRPLTPQPRPEEDDGHGDAGEDGDAGADGDDAPPGEATNTSV